MWGLSKASSSSKAQRAAESLTASRLMDELQRYVNSAGAATRHYEATADPVALDVIIENAGIIAVLASELQARGRQTAYLPAPDPHLENLTQRFLARQAARKDSTALL